MTTNLPSLISSKFISRPDVKAIQYSDGSWSPHTDSGKADGEYLPWKRKDLEAHLAGEMSFGHYLLSEEDKVKLFAFDIDLEKNQPDPEKPRFYIGHWVDDEDVIHEFDAREAWRDRKHPSRNWLKYQLKMAATQLAAAVTSELDIHCSVAYSGGKGIHVYGFTGAIPADDAREGAMIVLDSLGTWEATRGDNFYRTIDQDPRTGFPNLTIELFPKQGSLSGKNLGNLMRLPLGRNLKAPKDPTFFIDMTSPMGQMVPIDPIRALTTSPWKMAHE